MNSILNEKGNLIIRNCHYLVPTNEKFVIKHDHESAIEPSKTTSQKTLGPPKLTYLQISLHRQLQQKSRDIIGKPERPVPCPGGGGVL